MNKNDEVIMKPNNKIVSNVTNSAGAKEMPLVMEKDTIAAFRDILRRIYLKENSEKYQLICTKVCNADEERIWQLCKAFWHPKYSYRTFDIEKYEPNPNLDDITAKRYIKELTQLLDKLGWHTESK